MLIDSCPYVWVHRLLVRLKVVDEVQKDTLEAVPLEAFSHDEHCSVGIDRRPYNLVVALVPKSSDGGVNMKYVG